MGELLSVIVPIYNSEKWLEKCLNSIKNQTYKNLEIILIDDGSTDGSGLICDNFALSDKRAVVIHQKNNGVSYTRNVGIKTAKGKYIEFVDSDDSIEENACETMVSLIEENDVDEVLCGLNIYEKGTLLRTPHLNDHILNVMDNFENFKYIYPIFASPCNKLYKRNLVEEYDTSQSLGEDFIFNLKVIIKTKKVAITHKCLYNVCLDNENSLNRKFRDNKMELMIELEQKRMNLCSEAFANTYDKSFFDNLLLRSLHAYFRNICNIKDKDYCLEKISEYASHPTIKENCIGANPKAFDKKIFKFILFKGNPHMIYSFFKTKSFLVDKKSR